MDCLVDMCTLASNFKIVTDSAVYFFSKYLVSIVKINIDADFFCALQRVTSKKWWRP